MNNYRRNYKPYLTEGNRADVKNLSNILMAISGVARQFALELSVYSKSEICGCCRLRRGR